MRLLSAAIATLALALLPATAGATTLNATPSTFAAQVTAAQPGDTVLLAAGNYGTWTGTNKAITVKAAAGASPTMGFDLDTGDGNFTLDGVRGDDTWLSNGVHDVTIRNSTFSGTMKVDGLNAANVVLDHDTFTNDYSGCLPRIWLPYVAQHDSGLTVQNSRFTAGSHDGIQTGTAMSILNNEFVGIEHGSNQDCHTDNIQLYWGQANDGNGTTIKGNYIHDGESGITQYDGGGHNVIEDNVLARLSLFGLVFGGDKGSRIVHNVSVSVEKKGLDLSSKAGATSTGQTIKDNILDDITLGEGPPVSYTNNLIPGVGAPNISGSPVFAGGSAPATYAGFALAAGSPGKGRASDGLDVGARFGATPPPPPPADTDPPQTTITQAPTDGEATSALVAFTATEPGTFQCKLDTAAYSACASPQQLAGLAVGDHTFSVRATDTAGNTDPTPATVAWKVTAPPPPPPACQDELAALQQKLTAALDDLAKVRGDLAAMTDSRDAYKARAEKAEARVAAAVSALTG